MVMHEECLEGNFVTIERYRQAIVNQAAHPRAVPQVNDSIMYMIDFPCPIYMTGFFGGSNVKKYII